MRRLEPTEKPCESCGRVTGALFISRPTVLDFGVPTMPLMETHMLPSWCDDCGTLYRLADPEYRQVCGPMAEVWERQAIANGGVMPVLD